MPTKINNLVHEECEKEKYFPEPKYIILYEIAIFAIVYSIQIHFSM